MVAANQPSAPPAGLEATLLAAAQRYGLSPAFIEVELAACAQHLQRVGQPLDEVTGTLWLARRSLGACPVSNGCPKPKKGAVFCGWHQRFA